MKTKKYMAAIAGAAFALAGFGAQDAMALSAAQLFAKGGLANVTADDTSRETLVNNVVSEGDTGNILDVGDRLRGVLSIENFQYTNGASSESTGGSNDYVVAVFETEVATKVGIAPGVFNFGFGAPGGGDGVVATFYSLPGSTVFDIAQDSDASLTALFTGGTKLFDLSILSANGDFWNATAGEDTNGLSFANPANFGFDLTMTDESIPGLFFLSDDVLGNGKAFLNVTNNNDDFELANDVDLIFSGTIPEPMTAGLGLLSLGALALRRRRQA